jgi:beta-fructofuranosidase
VKILTAVAIPLMLTTNLVWAQTASTASSKSSGPDRKTDQVHRKMVDQANASVLRAKTRVEKDPNRPIFHLQPPALWNNDPNGPIFYHGTYHLFCQHNPYGDDWGHMHWGHFKSKDLIHWEHMPIALAPSEDLGEEHCFSGCATVTKKGQVMVIYTSIGKRLPEQWAAVPEDDELSRWRKHPANPILTEKLHGDTKVHEWRDPFVFESNGRTYMVCGGNLNAGQGGQAVVNVYAAENDDLTAWKYLGVLFTHPDKDVKNIECPLFFPLEGKWVLIVSQGRPVQYFVGELDTKTMRFKAKKRGVMDHGSYYAPNCMVDAKGRRVLWGWVQDFPKGKGWNGCLTLPRWLRIAHDLTLLQDPIPEMEKLRGQGHVYDDPSVTDEKVLTEKGDALEIYATLERGTAEEVGLKLRRSADGKKAITISFNGKKLHVAGLDVPFTPDFGGGVVGLHIFMDHSVLEVYAGRRRPWITRVVNAAPEDQGVAVFARGGKAQFETLRTWQVKSIWKDVGQ